MSKIANDNPLDDDNGITVDDRVLPFQLESSGVRGRLVRLGDTLDRIMAAHDYPAPVSHLLAESLVLTCLLSSTLKYSGIFTLQTSGEGAVKTLVSDMTSEGALRGYAAYAEDALNALSIEDGRYAGVGLLDLTGKGYVAFTVDQGAHTERYQGIVALEGETLGQSVRHYFDQSEQIGTSLHLHVTRTDEGQWRGGGLLLQRLPEDERFDLVSGITSIAENGREERDEDWNRAVILGETVKGEELIDSQLSPEELLVRLFHEEGVRVFDPQAIFHQCRCSGERVRTVLEGLSPEDLAYSAKDGVIEITCEFCSRGYSFELDQFKQP